MTYKSYLSVQQTVRGSREAAQALSHRIIEIANTIVVELEASAVLTENESWLNALTEFLRWAEQS